MIETPITETQMTHNKRIENEIEVMIHLQKRGKNSGIIKLYGVYPAYNESGKEKKRY